MSWTNLLDDTRSSGLLTANPYERLSQKKSVYYSKINIVLFVVGKRHFKISKVVNRIERSEPLEGKPYDFELESRPPRSASSSNHSSNHEPRRNRTKNPNKKKPRRKKIKARPTDSFFCGNPSRYQTIKFKLHTLKKIK